MYIISIILSNVFKITIHVPTQKLDDIDQGNS